ncbi:MAG: hypothetical protein V2B18_20785, partial [Pseudomonadota bacterium]
ITTVLDSLRNSDHEADLIRRALRTGSRTGADQADAVLAALTTLGHVYPDTFSSVMLRHDDPSNYRPLLPDWDREGVVYVLG